MGFLCWNIPPQRLEYRSDYCTFTRLSDRGTRRSNKGVACSSRDGIVSYTEWCGLVVVGTHSGWLRSWRSVSLVFWTILTSAYSFWQEQEEGTNCVYSIPLLVALLLRYCSGRFRLVQHHDHVLYCTTNIKLSKSLSASASSLADR